MPQASPGAWILGAVVLLVASALLVILGRLGRKLIDRFNLKDWQEGLLIAGVLAIVVFSVFWYLRS